MTIFKPGTLEIDYVPGKYLTEFEGWRGIAILLVLLLHYSQSLFSIGWVGMGLFFVLSGFFITGILVDSKSKPNYYWRFLRRRVQRIFPLYYLCLILLFFVMPASWLDMGYYRAHQLWFWFYMDNWLYAADGWPAVKALHHFWSLGIEEQFYVLWPLAIWLCGTRGMIRLCIFLFFFSLIFRNVGMALGCKMPFGYVATFARMEGLALGSMIAVMVRSERWKLVLEKWVYPVTVIAGIIAGSIILGTKSVRFWQPWSYTVNYSILAIFFAGMIVLSLCRDQFFLMKKILNFPALRRVGVISYCLYVFHYPILCIAEYNFLDYFERLTHHEMAGKLCCALVALAITIPVVYILHKKVELPIWKMGKKG